MSVLPGCQMALSGKTYVIRELLLEELPLLVDFWKTVGFMISAEFIESLWKADRAGMIVAVADDGEQPRNNLRFP